MKRYNAIEAVSEIILHFYNFALKPQMQISVAKVQG